MQADSIRDDMRDTAPLGAALTTASVEEPTPEEEEEEEEEEEGEDDDDGVFIWFDSEIYPIYHTYFCVKLDHALQHLTVKTMSKKIQMTRMTL